MKVSLVQQTVGVILTVYLCTDAVDAAKFWTDDLECSHEFSNKTVFRGVSIQSSGWPPPMFQQAKGWIIPCGYKAQSPLGSLLPLSCRHSNLVSLTAS